MARSGFKIVTANWKSFCGDVTWELDVEQRLADSRPLAMCQRGFHFCRQASHCLLFATWTKGCRLLRVAVPDGAASIDSPDDAKTCAQALVAVEDVTHQARDLLQLQVATKELGRTEYVGIDDDGNVCGVVRRPSGYRLKWWGGFNAWTRSFSQTQPDGHVISSVGDGVTLYAGTTRWAEAKKLLDKIEYFEPQPSLEA
jgi:hypothetical protein